MYRRNVTGRLCASLEDSPVVFLQGARQTGKSTLVKWLAGEQHPARYLTLDDPMVLVAAQGDPVGFISEFREPIIIDEVQRAPGLFQAIKRAVDRERCPGQFLLTGSADALLLPRVGEALTGRVELVTLRPLSQGELEGVVEGFVDAVFEEHLPLPESGANGQGMASRVVVGGYPEMLRRRTQQAREAWLDAYVALLVQRDIRELADIEHAVAMPRLLRMLAARTGSLLNYARLASELGLPQSTLKRYLAYLQVLFLHQPVPAWAANTGKRLMKSPKNALVDTGVAAGLLGVDVDRLREERTLLGSLLECFVVEELRKQRAWSRTRPGVFHLRTHSQQEVGIILEDRRGRVVGIEVKATHTVNKHDLAGLRLLRSVAGKRFVRGILLYMGEEAVPLGADLLALPIPSLWALQATTDGYARSGNR